MHAFVTCFSSLFCDLFFWFFAVLCLVVGKVEEKEGKLGIVRLEWMKWKKTQDGILL